MAIDLGINKLLPFEKQIRNQNHNEGLRKYFLINVQVRDRFHFSNLSHTRLCASSNS